ncbi:hypothetical protein [Sulfurivirga sp.]|uniref:hypothetical protein n=1 Tax=Sulfurivirga sp. TaxID=2614236 RepID=UPI0025E13B24|nr:hypothetical protein [Sulfurivirga sp.]
MTEPQKSTEQEKAITEEIESSKNMIDAERSSRDIKTSSIDDLWREKEALEEEISRLKKELEVARSGKG